MFENIKVFGGSQPAASESQQIVESPKTVESTTQQVASEYMAGGVAPNDSPSPPTRKTRRDKGMPRGSKKSLAVDSAEAQALASAEAGAARGFALDKAVVEKTCGVILDTVDKAIIRKVYKTTKRLGGDEDIAQELARNAGLSKDESGMMANLTGIVFEKRGWLTGYAPEILLSVLIGEWGLRITLTLRKLDELSKIKKPVKPQDAPPSSSN